MNVTGKLILSAAMILVAGLVRAGTPTAEEGYNAGLGVGQQAFDPNFATDPTQAQSLPNYNTNPPETAYFDPNSSAAAVNAGQSQMGTSDAGQITTSAQDTLTQQTSLATGTDPLFDQAGPVSPIGSTYTGCTTATTNTPGVTSTQICSATPPYENINCNKTLLVDVQVNESCLLGSTQAVISTYSVLHVKKGWYCYASASVVCGPALDGKHQVNISTNYWFSRSQQKAPILGTYNITLDVATTGAQQSQIAGCGYTFTSGGCDANNICSITMSDGYTYSTATFPLSRIDYVVTDQWDNGCATTEARLVQ